MVRLLVMAILLGCARVAVACDTPQDQDHPVDDIVYNTVTAEHTAMDLELQQMYGCKYPFAMLFGSSSEYEDMHLVSGSMPATPSDANDHPITGQVLVGFILNTDGIPVDPVLLRSPDAELSRIALDHVKGLRFQPSRLNGRSVRSLGVQVYDFK